MDESVDIDAVAGTRIASFAGFALLDLENAKVAQLDAAFLDQRVNDCLERPLDDLFRGQLREAALHELFFVRPLADIPDDFFLGHERVPSMDLAPGLKWGYCA
jgi:hypothetical protein